MTAFKHIIVAAIFFIVPFGAYASGCQEYEAEAAAISGVVPNFNADGTLRSILLHGEATFLTNKRSLINAARIKAELSAKQALSAFLNESVSAAQKADTLLEQAELTDQSGNTAGQALELTSIVETMQSNTEAVLKGVVKLDECVDVDQKYLLVTLGWKPKPAVISPEVAKGTAGPTVSENTQANPEKPQVVAAECVNRLKLEVVNITGYGRSQNEAVSDGIRIAVSQVFGEVFSSSINVSLETAALEVTDQNGSTQGIAVELSAEEKQMSSSTSGIVRSYKIINIKRRGTEFETELSVQIPIACNLDLEKGKLKAVVLKPSVTAHRDWTVRGDKLALDIKLELESLLNETLGLSVLSRSETSEIASELNAITIDNYSIDELVKKGNKLAADVLVLTKFSDFDTRRQRIKIGPDKTTDMYVTTAQAWVRVVDVVTSNLITSIRVPLSSKSFQKDQGVDAFTLTMAHNIASAVGQKVGGGFTESGTQLLNKSAERVASYEQAKERLSTAREKLEKEVENDW
jgi:hypothetical protein